MPIGKEKIFELAKGFRGRAKNCIKIARSEGGPGSYICGMTLLSVLLISVISFALQAEWKKLCNIHIEVEKRRREIGGLCGLPRSMRPLENTRQDTSCGIVYWYKLMH